MIVEINYVVKTLTLLKVVFIVYYTFVCQGQVATLNFQINFGTINKKILILLV
jgi:hypothetical protein